MLRLIGGSWMTAGYKAQECHPAQSTWMVDVYPGCRCTISWRPVELQSLNDTPSMSTALSISGPKLAQADTRMDVNDGMQVFAYLYIRAFSFLMFVMATDFFGSLWLWDIKYTGCLIANDKGAELSPDSDN